MLTIGFGLQMKQRMARIAASDPQTVPPRKGMQFTYRFGVSVRQFIVFILIKYV
jgi:hypothetical protein